MAIYDIGEVFVEIGPAKSRPVFWKGFATVILSAGNSAIS